MATLLMRLQAPMQSWGISSLFTERDTTREPSKSGVIGLICAAMGKSRESDISDLRELRMGVRVEREGTFEKDFQIARDILTADGGKADKTVISNRYYLADAVFLVGLEGDKETLSCIQDALINPKWSLYLGRKAFPPGKQVYLEDGLCEQSLLTALKNYPPLVKNENTKKRLIIEAEEGELTRQDVPIDLSKRKFLTRHIQIIYHECPEQKGG